MKFSFMTLLIISVGSVVLGDTPTADPAFKIVSKKISLGTYVPQDITDFRGVKISKRIVKDLQALLEAAKKDGLNLRVVSGYRSYRYQKNLFERYVKKEQAQKPHITRKAAEELANKYSALPGHSEHQLGTVVDILSAENNYSFELRPNLKYVDWLEKNSLRFNFKISYPRGGTEYVYEPWHLRWYPPQ